MCCSWVLHPVSSLDNPLSTAEHGNMLLPSRAVLPGCHPRGERLRLLQMFAQPVREEKPLLGYLEGSEDVVAG